MTSQIKNPFTYADLIRDLDQAKRPQGHSGMTSQDWAEHFGWGLKKTQQYLRREVKAGRMLVNKEQIIDVTGRINYTFIFSKIHPE